MKKLNGESLSLVDENIRALSKLFPEAVAEGKANFDILRQLLGDSFEVEQERYSFTWNGKNDAFRLSQTPSLGTLRPCKEESKNWNTTQNLYIEGDNLEVLKLLQKSYYGKVKMIYIDPPYNTGNDFVYKDNFKDSIDNYKHITGQIDGNGHNITTNTESNGRFHTDWLNMIYPRLRLARNLLTDDGVIFISIDDHEQANLKKICDEIFGEINFVADILWNSTKSVTNTALISVSHTHNLVYFKNMEYFIKNRMKFRLPDDGEGFSNPDNDPRGAWKADPFQVGGWRPNQQYEIINPKTGKIYKPNPGCSWKNDYEHFQKLLEDNRIVFGKTGESAPQRKRFIHEAVERGRVAKTWWDDVDTTTNGTLLLKEIFDDKTLFDNPKPVSLIKKILQLATEKESIVMDFFSGSATTAHAIMQLNVEDGGGRKFIMVQLPEVTPENSEAAKAGYENVCEIGKERIRRAGEKIKAGAVDETPDLDIGFKVFKLDSSNLKKWNPQPEDVMQSLLESVDNFLPERTELDVVYEIILKMGMELSTEIEEREVIGEKIYIVGGGSLMICLGENITLNIVDEMVKIHKEYNSELWQVVFHDIGFASDMDKTNIKETLKTAGLKEDNFVCI